jgi:hypothetical protein
MLGKIPLDNLEITAEERGFLFLEDFFVFDEIEVGDKYGEGRYRQFHQTFCSGEIS